MTTDMPAAPDGEPRENRDDDSLPKSPALVEDVLLLLFQPGSGTILGEGTLYSVLAGAVLTELALSNAVVLDESGLPKVRAVDGAPPDDPLLVAGWSYIHDKPRGTQTALAAIGTPLRASVLDRLVRRGDLRRETRTHLGFIRTTRFTLAGDRRQSLLAQVRAALVDGVTPDTRTAATVGLLSASGTLPQFHPEIPWTGTVASRSREFEQGEWGAKATASAVARTLTAIMVGAVAAASAARRP